MAYKIAQRRLSKTGSEPIYNAFGSDDLLENRSRLLVRKPPSSRGDVLPPRRKHQINWRRQADKPLVDSQANPQIATLGGTEMVPVEEAAPGTSPQQTYGPVSSREQLARLRAEQSAMEGLTRTDKKGRVLTGIDAVEDQNGALKSGLNSGLYGLTGVGGGAGQRGYGWTQLIAELARAGGMLLGGMLNKKHDERAKYQRGLDSNQAAQSELMKKIEQENKIVKGDADIEQTEIETRNKQAAPLLDLGKDMNNLSQVAPTIAKILGLPVPNTDYRKVERFEDMGVPMIAREGDPTSRPDESRYINPSEVVRDRTLGTGENKQVYRVSDKQALPAAVGIEQANANRSITIAKADADATDDDATASANYQADVNKYKGKQSEIQGAIDAENSTISLAEQDNANLQRELGALDPKEDKAEIQAIRKQMRDNNSRANAARSKIAKLNGEMKGLPAPVKPKPKTRISKPAKINPRRKGSYSDADVQNLIKQ